MKDFAHGAAVVVVLGTKVLALCKALSVLNGFSKIGPANISRSPDVASADEKYRVTETTGMVPRTFVLSVTMGWTEEEMEQCLRFKFPNLPQTKVREIAQNYSVTGNIRDAVNRANEMNEDFVESQEQGTTEEATEEAGSQAIPQATTKSTGTSTPIDSGEFSRPSLVDTTRGTSDTPDERDEDQDFLNLMMSKCDMWGYLVTA